VARSTGYRAQATKWSTCVLAGVSAARQQEHLLSGYPSDRSAASPRMPRFLLPYIPHPRPGDHVHNQRVEQLRSENATPRRNMIVVPFRRFRKVNRAAPVPRSAISRGALRAPRAPLPALLRSRRRPGSSKPQWNRRALTSPANDIHDRGRLPVFCFRIAAVSAAAKGIVCRK
jgi:hypothetical protein